MQLQILVCFVDLIIIVVWHFKPRFPYKVFSCSDSNFNERLRRKLFWKLLQTCHMPTTGKVIKKDKKNWLLGIKKQIKSWSVLFMSQFLSEMSLFCPHLNI